MLPVWISSLLALQIPVITGDNLQVSNGGVQYKPTAAGKTASSVSSMSAFLGYISFWLVGIAYAIFRDEVLKHRLTVQIADWDFLGLLKMHASKIIPTLMGLNMWKVLKEFLLLCSLHWHWPGDPHLFHWPQFLCHISRRANPRSRRPSHTSSSQDNSILHEENMMI